MNILFIGDIVGRPGRNAVKAILPEVKEQYNLDLILANGENLAGGLGLTLDKYQEMLDAGIDYFTTGNHVLAKKEFAPYLDDASVKVIRPANLPASFPGRGSAIIHHQGKKILLFNLMGKAFMKDDISDCFATADEILAQNEADIKILDFHAEATSEKAIFAWYLDGRVTIFVGTHTHVPTADERILPKGTAFQSDLGMTGPINSTLGAKIEPFLQAMRTGEPARYEIAQGPVVFNATLFRVGEDNNVSHIERIQKMYEPV